VSDVLGVRALNRATLARQLLLERAGTPALDAVEHLVGMQAQIPHDPYLGLWSRLASFDHAELGRLLVERKVVRIVVMRGTIHLVSADDCLQLRPLMQPVLDAELRRHREFGPALEGVDVAPVLAYVRTLVAQAPRSGTQLRAAIAQRFPQHDAAALAYACRNLLAFVQVPPRGVWGETMEVRSTTVEHWLGRPLAAAPSIDEVVLRYLAAFGPATVADIASWSRLTGMRAVVERIAPRLRTFRDERGRVLYDLPDAPRPDADTPAPVRFLPEYDNVLLSHADRARLHRAEQRGRLTAAAPRKIKGTVLVDGVVQATWRIDRADDGATLLVDHAVAFPRGDAQAVEAEGERMLRFLEPERAATGGEVRLVRLES
jgi:winged helix DNA-binding protein